MRFFIQNNSIRVAQILEQVKNNLEQLFNEYN